MGDDEEEARARVTALTGVYHAKGTLSGELAYWVGARLGRAHCALCDITHGTFRARPEFVRCAEGLPVPFATVHLDERTSEVAEVSEGRTPCVVAHLDGVEPLVLLGPAELEACDGRPDVLIDALEQAVATRGLRWS
jgi:hypothetical protein